jgi:hypothetical protein
VPTISREVVGTLALCPPYNSAKTRHSKTVIARSEATKQSILSLRGEMDCFASLAMTVSISGMVSRSRGAMRLSFDLNFSPPRKQRAQGRPGARCTRGLVCKLHKKMRTRAYRFSGEHPAFPAQWFYGL